MEPVFAVVQEPPVPPQQPHQLGQMTQVQGGGWRVRRRARFVLALVLFVLAVTGNFAFSAYRARHASRDLAFVLVAYFLLALLVCCVVKLEQLRRHPAPRGAERRWVRIAVWAISAALGNMFASPVADAMPRPALKLVVLGVTAVVLGLVFYFLLFSKDAERCCDAELDRPWPS